MADKAKHVDLPVPNYLALDDLSNGNRGLPKRGGIVELFDRLRERISMRHTKPGTGEHYMARGGATGLPERASSGVTESWIDRSGDATDRGVLGPEEVILDGPHADALSLQQLEATRDQIHGSVDRTQTQRDPVETSSSPHLSANGGVESPARSLAPTDLRFERRRDTRSAVWHRSITSTTVYAMCGQDHLREILAS